MRQPTSWAADRFARSLPSVEWANRQLKDLDEVLAQQSRLGNRAP